MDPLTALLMLFAYEKRTGKILTDKQIQDGDLRDLLQPEDFENAEKVLAFLYFLFVIVYPVFVTVQQHAECPPPTVLLQPLSNGGNFLQLGSPFFLPHNLCMREYVRLVDHHSNFDSSCFPLQMKDLHSERCQYTSNILPDLIAQGDQEALQVVAAAAKDGIVGMYLYFPFSFWLPEHLPTEAFSRMQVDSLHSPRYFTGFYLICFCFPGHDLETVGRLRSSEGP